VYDSLDFLITPIAIAIALPIAEINHTGVVSSNGFLMGLQSQQFNAIDGALSKMGPIRFRHIHGTDIAHFPYLNSVCEIRRYIFYLDFQLRVSRAKS